MQPRAKLTVGRQQVDIVAAHKVLRQRDDGTHQGLLDGHGKYQQQQFITLGS